MTRVSARMWRDENPHTLLVNVKWCNHFGKQFGSSSKTVTKWSSNSTPRYIPNGNQSICPHKNLYANLHKSIIHASQKLETIKMTINWWKNKMWYMHILFYCTSKTTVVFTVFFFNKLKVYDNPVLRNSIGANFPKTICFTCFCVIFW